MRYSNPWKYHSGPGGSRITSIRPTTRRSTGEGQANEAVADNSDIDTGNDDTELARMRAELEEQRTLVAEQRELLSEKEQQVREANLRACGAEEELERAKVRLRKESARQLEQHKHGVLSAFLDVLDDLDRAVKAGQKQSRDPAMWQGVNLVRKGFLAKLEQFDVCRFASLGEPFDPELHEAVNMIPVTDPGRDGIVLGVIREGYRIGDAVLRPAAVAVGKMFK